MEELRERHAAGLVDGVVEQSCAPQCGIFSEQDTVDAGQALLCGVQGLQVVLLPGHAAAPWLVVVVDAAEIMCAWWTERYLSLIPSLVRNDSQSHIVTCLLMNRITLTLQGSLTCEITDFKICACVQTQWFVPISVL